MRDMQMGTMGVSLIVLLGTSWCPSSSGWKRRRAQVTRYDFPAAMQAAFPDKSLDLGLADVRLFESHGDGAGYRTGLGVMNSRLPEQKSLERRGGAAAQ